MSVILSFALAFLASSLRVFRMRKERRLEGHELFAALVALLIVFVPSWEYVCGLWASVAVPRFGDWMPPALQLFLFDFEKVIGPFLCGAIVYSYFAMMIFLMAPPEWVDEEERPEWRLGVMRKYQKWIWSFCALELIYYAVTSPWRDLSGF